MANKELTKEQRQEFNKGLFNMYIIEGEHRAYIAEYFYRLGLNSKYKNNNNVDESGKDNGKDNKSI